MIFVSHIKKAAKRSASEVLEGVFYETSLWARLRQVVAAGFTFMAVFLYWGLIQSGISVFHGGKRFLEMDSYRALGNIISIELVEIWGNLAVFGIWLLPLMYLFGAWYLLTWKYRTKPQIFRP